MWSFTQRDGKAQIQQAGDDEALLYGRKSSLRQGTLVLLWRSLGEGTMRAVKGQRATAMPVEDQANNGEASVKPVGGLESDDKACHTQIETKSETTRSVEGQ